MKFIHNSQHKQINTKSYFLFFFTSFYVKVKLTNWIGVCGKSNNGFRLMGIYTSINSQRTTLKSLCGNSLIFQQMKTVKKQNEFAILPLLFWQVLQWIRIKEKRDLKTDPINGFVECKTLRLFFDVVVVAALVVFCIRISLDLELLPFTMR